MNTQTPPEERGAATDPATLAGPTRKRTATVIGLTCLAIAAALLTAGIAPRLEARTAQAQQVAARCRP